MSYKEVNINEAAEEKEAALNKKGNGIDEPKMIRGLQDKISSTDKSYVNKNTDDYTKEDWENYASDSYARSKLRHYDVLRSTTPENVDDINREWKHLEGPEYSYSRNWGDSMFDEPYYFGIPDAQTLKDDRANNQPWYAKIAAGIGKGAVITATTAVSGTAGTVAGLYSWASTGSFSNYWDNPVTRALHNIEQKSEELMPNYTTTEEDENPLRLNMFLSANFWGNDIIKNFGFMVGAFYSGMPLAKAMQGLSKSYQRRVRNKMLNNLNKTAQKEFGEVEKAISSGISDLGNQTNDMNKVRELTMNALKQNNSSEELSRAYLEYFNKINDISKATKSVSSGIGAFQSAVNEGAIEALNNSNDYKQSKMVELDAWYEETKQGILRSKNTEPGMEFELLKGLNNEYEQRKAKIERAAQYMGNADLLANLPILLFGNTIQYGKLYASNFSKMSSVLRRSNRVAEGLIEKEGRTVSNKSFIKGLGNGLKNTVVVEGNEEFSQRAAADAAKDYADARLNKMIMDKVPDEDTLNDTVEYLSDFASRYWNNWKDPSAVKEAVVGGLSSLLGMPTFGKTNNHNAYIGKDSKFGLSGGIVGEVSDYMEQKEREDAIGQAWDNIKNNPKKVAAIKNIIRSFDNEKEMRNALFTGDKKMFEDVSFDETVDAILTAVYADKLEEFKAMTEFNKDLSDEDIDELLKNDKSNILTVDEQKQKDAQRRDFLTLEKARLEVNKKSNLMDNIYGSDKEIKKYASEEDRESIKGEKDLKNKKIKSDIRAIDKELEEIDKRLKNNDYKDIYTGAFTNPDGTSHSRESVRKQIADNVESMSKAIDDVIDTMTNIDEESGGTLSDEDVSTLTKLRMATIDQEHRIIATSQELINNVFPKMKKTFEAINKKNEPRLKKLQEKYNKSNDDTLSEKERKKNELSEEEKKEKKNLEDSKEKHDTMINIMDTLASSDAMGMTNMFVYQKELMGQLKNLMSVGIHGFFNDELKKYVSDFDDALKLSEERLKYMNKFNELLGNPELMNTHRKDELTKRAQKEFDGLVDQFILDLSKCKNKIDILNLIVSGKYKSDIINDILQSNVADKFNVLEGREVFRNLSESNKKLINDSLLDFYTFNRSYSTILKNAASSDYDDAVKTTILSSLSELYNLILSPEYLKDRSIKEGIDGEYFLSKSFISEFDGIIEAAKKIESDDEESKDKIIKALEDIKNEFKINLETKKDTKKKKKKDESKKDKEDDEEKDDSKKKPVVEKKDEEKKDEKPDPEEIKKKEEERIQKLLKDDEANDELKIKEDKKDIENNSEKGTDAKTRNPNNTQSEINRKTASTNANNLHKSIQVSEYSYKQDTDSNELNRYTPESDLDKNIQSELSARDTEHHLNAYDINNIGLSFIFTKDGTEDIFFGINKKGDNEYVLLFKEVKDINQVKKAFKDKLSYKTINGKIYVIVGCIKRDDTTYNAKDDIKNAGKKKNLSFNNIFYTIKEESKEAGDSGDGYFVSVHKATVKEENTGKLRAIGKASTLKELRDKSHVYDGSVAIGLSDGSITLEDKSVIPNTVIPGAIYLYIKKADNNSYPIYVLKRSIEDILKLKDEGLLESDPFYGRINSAFEELKEFDGKEATEDNVKNAIAAKNDLLKFFSKQTKAISIVEDDGKIKIKLYDCNNHGEQFDIEDDYTIEDFLNDVMLDATTSIPIEVSKEKGIFNDLLDSNFFSARLESFDNYNADFLISLVDGELKEVEDEVILTDAGKAPVRVFESSFTREGTPTTVKLKIGDSGLYEAADDSTMDAVSTAIAVRLINSGDTSDKTTSQYQNMEIKEVVDGIFEIIAGGVKFYFVKGAGAMSSGRTVFQADSTTGDLYDDIQRIIKDANTTNTYRNLAIAVLNLLREEDNLKSSKGLDEKEVDAKEKEIKDSMSKTKDESSDEKSDSKKGSHEAKVDSNNFYNSEALKDKDTFEELTDILADIFEDPLSKSKIKKAEKTSAKNIVKYIRDNSGVSLSENPTVDEINNIISLFERGNIDDTNACS